MQTTIISTQPILNKNSWDNRMFFAAQCCGTSNKAHGNDGIGISYLGENTHQNFFSAVGLMQKQVLFNCTYACTSYEKHEKSHYFAM